MNSKLKSIQDLLGTIGTNVGNLLSPKIHSPIPTPTTNPIQQISNYFNPTKSADKGFWGTPVARAMANAQQFIESPKPYKPIPSIQINKNDTIPSKIGKTITNIPIDIGNTIVGQGIMAPISDVSQMIGRGIGGREPLQFKNAKSGATQLGLYGASMVNPDVASQYGVPKGAKQFIGAAAKTALPVAAAYGGGKVFGLGPAAVESAGVQTLFQTIKQGAISGLKFGGVFGLLQGLQDARDTKSNAQYLKTVGGETAGGAAVGGVAGGSIAGVAHVFGSIRNGLAALLNKKFNIDKVEAPQKVDQFIRDELGRFTKQEPPPKNEPQYYGDMREAIGLPRNGDNQIPMGLSVKPKGGSAAMLAAEQTKGGGIVTDPALVQEIKNSIAEGQLTLRTGSYNGKKLSPEEMLSVRKSVENSLAKIGESRIGNTGQGYKISDVTPAGYGPEVPPLTSNTTPPVETPKTTNPDQFIKDLEANQFQSTMPPPLEKLKTPTVNVDSSAQYQANIGGGGFTGKPDPAVTTAFRDWVNLRKSTNLDTYTKAKEFSDLNSKGLNGILEFQNGDQTGRLADVKNYFDTKFNQLKDANVQMGYKKNYLPQLWANSQDQVNQVFQNRLSTHAPFTMSAVIKDYAEGIQAGLTPRFKNVGELAGWYEGRANKLLADKGFFDYLAKDSFVMPASRAPKDWVTLNPDSFPKIKINIPGGNVMKPYPTEYTGTYKAPKPLADMINNYLGAPTQEGLAKIANFTSESKNRLLSFGIPGTGINAHGFNIMARNAMTDQTPFIGFIKGGAKGLYYMANPNAAGNYVEQNLAKAGEGIKAGLTLSTQEYKSVYDEPTSLRSKFGNTWNNLFEKPLFNKMIPALKIQRWEQLSTEFSKTMPENAAKRQAADLVNQWFGGINWEAMGKNRDIQNFKRSAILAPDWLATNLGLGKDLVLNLFKSGPVASKYRNIITNIMGMYATANVINLTTSGHSMIQNDPGHAFDIEAGYTNDGQKRYIRVFGTAADFIRIPIDSIVGILKGDPSPIARAISNRLSTILGPATALVMNVNYKGQPIYGKDKYGNPMDAKQVIGGIGGEVGTMAGFPSFLSNAIDIGTGKQGLEQGALQGMELPFRYSGGAYSKTQKGIVDVAKQQGASGKDLYSLSKLMSGQSLSKNQMDYIQQTGDVNYVNKVLQNRADKAAAKGTTTVQNETGYVQSKDAPQGILPVIGTYGKALITDPGQTIKAVLNGNPVRKVQGGAVILERQKGLSVMDNGNKATQVDHKIALTLGGTNDKSNLQTLTNAENQVKGEVETYLYNQMKAGNISKAEAQKRDLNWKQEIDNLPSSAKQKLVNNLATSTAPSSQTSSTYKSSLNGIYYLPQNDGNIKKIDLSTEIKAPTLSGNTELDKKLTSKYKSQLTSRANDIVSLYEAGKITKDQASSELDQLKAASTKYTAPKKIPWSKFKVKQIKMPKMKTIKLKKLTKLKLSDISSPRLTASKSANRNRPLTSIV